MSDLALASVVALVAGTGWLARLTLPSSQGVRVRNAFLLRRGRPSDFTWTPSNVPVDFRVERRSAPVVIQEAVRAARLPEPHSDWDQSLALVTMLVRNWREDGAIQADLTTTYNRILAGSGYCADYVRVFLAAAGTADLFCRQWAFSFDGFGGHGHTFVEVFDRQRGRWIFLDVHNNVYATLAGNDEPLSGLDLRQALVSGTPIEFRRAGAGRVGFRYFDKLFDYYCRGAAQWYLWWGNDVVTRDSKGIAGASASVSGRLANIVTSAFDLPPIMAIVSTENEAQIAAMERLRRHVVLAVVVVGLLVALIGGVFVFGRP